MIKKLIDSGAYVDSLDQARRSPLHVAASNNNMECIKYLLIELADPLRRNIDGKTAIELAKDPEVIYLIERATKIRENQDDCTFIGRKKIRNQIEILVQERERIISNYY